MKFGFKDIIALSGIGMLLFLGLFLFAGCESPTQVEEPLVNGYWRGTVIIFFSNGQVTETYDIFLTSEGNAVTGSGSLSGSSDWSIELEGLFNENFNGTEKVQKITGNMTLLKHGYYNRYTSFDLQLRKIEGMNKLKGLLRSDIYGEYPIQLGEKLATYNVDQIEYPAISFHSAEITNPNSSKSN